eukprot:2761501-Amphidinium_carterae.1
MTPGGVFGHEAKGALHDCMTKTSPEGHAIMQRPLLHDSRTAQGVVQSCSAPCCMTKSCNHAAPFAA